MSLTFEVNETEKVSGLGAHLEWENEREGRRGNEREGEKDYFGFDLIKKISNIFFIVSFFLSSFDSDSVHLIVDK